QENPAVVPPHPDYTNFRRPSDGWLEKPAWIVSDGGLNPPQFYYSHEEILTTLFMWNPDHPCFTERPTAPDIYATGTAGVAFPQQQSAAPLGHQQPAGTANAVNVHAFYTAPDKLTTRGGKAAPKKQKDSKFGMIDVTGLDRCSFIQATLATHLFGADYSPGVHQGPSFKISWTGSLGGKSGAVTIDNDHEWTLTVAALKRKNGSKPAVLVEYNLDEMDGYQVTRKRTLAQDSDDPELLHGTKVPGVDDFSLGDQINGMFALKLKEHWRCEKHLGEHGDVGQCYVDTVGQHIGLNKRKIKVWAAAMAAGDTMKHEPPDVAEFDGARDGRLTNARPRGRGGPRSAGASSSMDTSASELLMAAILTNLAPRSVAPASASTIMPTTPPRTPLANLPATPQKPAPPMFPIPTTSSELHTCLTDFLKVKAIDILSCESSLATLELTPAIISEVPISRLKDITGAVEGRLWSFQIFCREWCLRPAEKKRQALLL
ncbi:hypothetical protein C8R44DRAFT_649479, partial [Mycena epipterygia]